MTLALALAIRQPKSQFSAVVHPPEAFPLTQPELDNYYIRIRHGSYGFWHEDYVIYDERRPIYARVDEAEDTSRIDLETHFKELAAELNDAVTDPDFNLNIFYAVLRRPCSIQRLCAGFPFHALEGTVACQSEQSSETKSNSGTVVKTESHLVSANIPFDGRQADITIPTGIIWTGALGNAIVFAIPVAMLTFLAGLLRRTMRTRRGLCPTCKYPIGSSPRCSECGEPVPTRCVRSTLQ